jgi:fibronectin type 3 domain-containing protein
MAAVQRGDRIVIQLTLPTVTTDGVGLTKVRDVDLRIGGEGLQPWHRETWEASATRINVDERTPDEQVRVEVEARPWVGREVMLAVRTQGPSGRLSDWSNLVPVQVVEPLDTPSALVATATRDGVALVWQSSAAVPGRNFRIFRRTPPEQAFVSVGQTTETSWTDRSTRYGTIYEYTVQAAVPAGSSTAESELSEAAAITPQDRFPPDVPAGLNALAGLGAIELTWDRVPEEGVVYRLYRMAEAGELVRIESSLDVVAYSDRKVTAGVRYSYAVSAVDGLGNESEKSATVAVVAP